MPYSFYSVLPDAEMLLSLEPEGLAVPLLKFLSKAQVEQPSVMNRNNVGLTGTVEGYPPDRKKDIRRALMEAWVWLEREGLIAPDPEQSGDWVFVTRRGKQLAESSDLKAYQAAHLLPRGQLHPITAQKVWSLFARGDYDTAVFEAYKAVEVRVREAGGYQPTDLGVPLMREAFKPGSGPLADKAAPEPEQLALASLFAGAIGYYKNPLSHRDVRITDPADAVDMIFLASHLLKIVDARKAAT